MQVDPAWLITAITTVLGAMASGIAVVYRGQVDALKSDLRDKQAIIDRLLTAQERSVDAQEDQVKTTRRVADAVVERVGRK